MNRLKIVNLECFNPKCLHRWVPRKPREPKTCPECSSYYWNEKEHWVTLSTEWGKKQTEES